MGSFKNNAPLSTTIWMAAPNRQLPPGSNQGSARNFFFRKFLSIISFLEKKRKEICFFSITRKRKEKKYFFLEHPEKKRKEIFFFQDAGKKNFFWKFLCISYFSEKERKKYFR